MNISEDAVADLSAVNFLANFQSAFFAQGYQALTSWNATDARAKVLLSAAKKTQNQADARAAAAAGILTYYGRPTFKPCTYNFPDINKVDVFINIADIVNVMFAGTMIDILDGFNQTDPDLVNGKTSILGSQARQNTIFNMANPDLADDPNPAQFDTRIPSTLALNLANPFLNHCDAKPSFTVIPTLASAKTLQTTSSFTRLDFRYDSTQVKDLKGSLYIGWINQASEVKYTTAKVTGLGNLEAVVPDGMAGMSYAVLTKQNDFSDVGNLTATALAGPAPVRIS